MDKEKARTIAQEINEQIFTKVRDALRKVHNMKEEGEEEQEKTREPSKCWTLGESQQWRK